MRRDPALLRAQLLGAGALLLAMALWAGALWALAAALLAADARAAIAGALAEHAPLLGLVALAGAGALAAAAAAVAKTLYRRHVSAPVRLLEQGRALLQPAAAPLPPQDGPLAQALAALMGELVAQREQLRSDIEARVAEGSRAIEQERQRLAALMTELTQAVVVCNLDGRVLLYNQRARLQFKALSSAPQVAGGADLIGLGRSIYAVFDRRLVAHALENIQQRLQRGAAHPSAQFVTGTPGGQLLRARMGPVLGAAAAGGPAALSGFVLMLDNITGELRRDLAQDQALLALTEGSRASLGNLQAALDVLDDASLDAAARGRFMTVVRDEARAMAQRLHETAAASAEELRTRWPLEDMLGADLVAAAQRRIETACGVRTGSDEVDATLWLRVDSFALLQALAGLATRLVEEFEVRALRLRLLKGDDGKRARLDLIWSGQAMSTETVMSWEAEPLRVAGETSALTVRDVVQRHGGEFWFERDRVRHQAFFRFLLPLAADSGDAEALNEVAAGADSRPEFYDFDLFQSGAAAHALDDTPLAALACTVFDTETTGLDPAGGDRIIQIGAVRIVGGRLLRQEAFEQLVDPGRGIPAAGIPIHGITPEMVRGQPTLDRVLPAFHAYARDSVLVAHNAAFDLRFLQLAEAATGVRFEQPVLDTLLLSALVHPQQESHRLEAIAERFGIPVIGRHTALGDALVTAEVYLKLLPLLQGLGITTLGQAREAAARTWYARLKY
ncbi:MAG: 3'-5' exonuclease [Rubrivivax sp.]|nr:3'-5' exonuclease [Rubrivivax sp.]